MTLWTLQDNALMEETLSGAEKWYTSIDWLFSEPHSNREELVTYRYDKGVWLTFLQLFVRCLPSTFPLSPSLVSSHSLLVPFYLLRGFNPEPCIFSASVLPCRFSPNPLILFLQKILKTFLVMKNWIFISHSVCSLQLL